MVSVASAYETIYNKGSLKDRWKSIFICSGLTAKECIQKTRDEHPALSEIALQRIGAAKAYGLKGDNLYVTDLNASLFHLDDEGLNSILARRNIPAPALFSSIPDFNHTIYDWVNKSHICPVLPEQADNYDKCHMFKGWMGALNSSHFGSQTAKIYTYMHALALKEAAHARSLREKIAADGKIDQKDLKDFVREAEFFALAYEGFAQHFLADRWSVGHMWERWNAPDYKNRAFSRLDGNFEVGVAAGLLHGSEDITTLEDPMSSPSISKTDKGILDDIQYLDKWQKRDLRKTLGIDKTVKLQDGVKTILGTGIKKKLKTIVSPITGLFMNANEDKIDIIRKQKFFARYRHEGQAKASPSIDSIGDLRLNDMMYERYMSNVPRQREEMFGCLSAGWSEVIRAFGQGKGGGFGSRNVKLHGVAGFKALNYKCDDVWATNGAIGLGWNLDYLVGTAGKASNLINLGHLGLTDWKQAKHKKKPTTIWGRARAWVKTKVARVKSLYHKVKSIGTHQKGNGLDRQSWIAITANISLYNNVFGPKGTELAQGGIGPFGSALTGDHYGIPDYLPPKDLDQLPNRDDKTGRDKVTIFGLFNKAHADYWCGKAGVKELIKLRESGTKKDLAACRYLAARFYEGTDLKYSGNMQEKRTDNGEKYGYPSHGICYYYGGRKMWNPNTPDKVPVYLSPGYVSKPYSLYYSSGYESVANWCEKIPIFDYVRGPGREIPDETVYKAKKWDEDIVLKGDNFGGEPGNLWINCDKAKKRIPGMDILLWKGDQIKFRMDVLTAREKAANNVTVCIETDKGLKSVGRFVIFVEKQPVQITNFKVSAKGKTYVSMNEGILKPIPPGPASYEITFSELMDKSEGVTVAFEGPKGRMDAGVLLLNTIYLKGRWVSDTVWRGEYDNPASSEAGETTQFVLKGRQPVLIQARSLSGALVETGEKDTTEGVRIYGRSGKAHEFFSNFYNRYNHDIVVTFGEKGEKPPKPIIHPVKTPSAGLSGCWQQTDTGWIALKQNGNEFELRLYGKRNVEFDLPGGRSESKLVDISNLPFSGRVIDGKIHLFRPITSYREWEIFRYPARDLYNQLKDTPGLGSEIIFEIRPINGGEPRKDIQSLNRMDFEGGNYFSPPPHWQLWAQFYPSTHRTAYYLLNEGEYGEYDDIVVDYRKPIPARYAYADAYLTVEKLRVSRARIKLGDNDSPFTPTDTDREEARVTFYNPDFTRQAEMARSGEKVGIRAEIKGGCPTSIDMVDVTVWPEYDGKKGYDQPVGFSAILTETGPNTGVYQSPSTGFSVPYLHSGRSNKSRLTGKLFVADAMERGINYSLIFPYGHDYFPEDYQNPQENPGGSDSPEKQTTQSIMEKLATQSGESVSAELGKHEAVLPSRVGSGTRNQGGASVQTKQPKNVVKQPASQPRTISVNGGSRTLHAGVPARRSPTKQAPEKPVKWTVYKLVVTQHGSRLPTMDVLKLSFQKGAKRAAFRVMRYPVFMVRNDQTGKIIWSISSAGDVVENKMAIQPDMIDALEVMANDKKKGSVEKSALAGMINRKLGPDAAMRK